MTDTLALDRQVDDIGDSAKRRQILDGARQVFLTQGFDAASMMDIAKAAGVSKGTLYVYFKDKDDLFDGMVRKPIELAQLITEVSACLPTPRRPVTAAVR